MEMARKPVDIPKPMADFDDPLIIMVYVVSLDDDKKIAEHKIDYSKADARKFLGKLTFWAINNRHYIQTMLLSDVDLPTKDS